MIVSYESNSQKARRTGGAAWLHEASVFSVKDQRALAKIASFSFNGGTMVGNIVTREDAEAMAIAGIARTLHRRDLRRSQ